MKERDLDPKLPCKRGLMVCPRGKATPHASFPSSWNQMVIGACHSTHNILQNPSCGPLLGSRKLTLGIWPGDTLGFHQLQASGSAPQSPSDLPCSLSLITRKRGAHPRAMIKHQNLTPYFCCFYSWAQPAASRELH